jgi:Flp pilus assembly protein protease CpaA
MAIIPIPPLYLAAFICCASAYAIASTVYDLKLRIIPDWLNYLSLIAAVACCWWVGRLDLGYAIFVAAAFVFSWLLYQLGVWAGGDVKFFTAASAWFGLLKSTQPVMLVLAFIASALLTLPVAMAIFHRRIWENRKAVSPVAANTGTAAILSGVFSAIAAVAAVPLGLPAGIIAGIAASLIYSKSKVAGIILALACIAYSPLQFVEGGLAGAILGGLVFFVLGSFWAIAPFALRRKVAVTQLCEGDIPYSSVYLVDGKVKYWNPPSFSEVLSMAAKLDAQSLSSLRPAPNPIASSLDAGGLTPQQINALKEAGVTHLVVKESLPFAPAIAIGFAVLWFLV